MKTRSVVKVAITVLFLWSTATFAGMVTPAISGQSTATMITEGDYEGFYLYQIDVVWDFGPSAPGLSHWDLILKEGCILPDHIIEFDSPAGFSTSEQFPFDPNVMGWSGYFERKGDPSLEEDSGPVVKYNNPFFPGCAEPGAIGYGTFFFYSNIIPEYGVYPDVLVGKAGQIPDIYGDLEGAYPSCTIVPEPATICMLGMGGGLLLMRRR